jgi:hypothetical protein
MHKQPLGFGSQCWPVAFRTVPLYGSQDSAYHQTYRRQLRPSSRLGPRHPPRQVCKSVSESRHPCGPRNFRPLAGPLITSLAICPSNRCIAWEVNPRSFHCQHRCEICPCQHRANPFSFAVSPGSSTPGRSIATDLLWDLCTQNKPITNRLCPVFWYPRGVSPWILGPGLFHRQHCCLSPWPRVWVCFSLSWHPCSIPRSGFSRHAALGWVQRLGTRPPWTSLRIHTVSITLLLWQHRAVVHRPCWPPIARIFARGGANPTSGTPPLIYIHTTFFFRV